MKHVTLAIVVGLALGCFGIAAVYYMQSRAAAYVPPHTCSAQYVKNGVTFRVEWDDPRECDRLVRSSAPQPQPPASAPSATPAPPQP